MTRKARSQVAVALGFVLVNGCGPAANAPAAGSEAAGSEAPPTTSPGTSAPSTVRQRSPTPEGVTLVPRPTIADPHHNSMFKGGISKSTYGFPEAEGEMWMVYSGEWRQGDTTLYDLILGDEDHPKGVGFDAEVGVPFSYHGSVFSVTAESTEDRLVYEVWGELDLSGIVPYFKGDAGAVDEVPTSPPQVVMLAPPPLDVGPPDDIGPGAFMTSRAGGPDKPSDLLFDLDPPFASGDDVKPFARVRVGDRFQVAGIVFEVVDSVENESVTLHMWLPEVDPATPTTNR